MKKEEESKREKGSEWKRKGNSPHFFLPTGKEKQKTKGGRKNEGKNRVPLFLCLPPSPEEKGKEEKGRRGERTEGEKKGGRRPSRVPVNR